MKNSAEYIDCYLILFFKTNKFLQKMLPLHLPKSKQTRLRHINILGLHPSDFIYQKITKDYNITLNIYKHYNIMKIYQE